MQLYLPIAELPLSFFLLLGMGGAIGFISGMFGVGGGFLLTPLLIFVVPIMDIQEWPTFATIVGEL